jgi:hypothetical protein
MRDDPIVEEIRRIRDAHSARFNCDLEAICQDVKRSEEQLKTSGWRFVTAPPGGVEPHSAERQSAT